jgi:DNA-binding NarL/FixJ family response regulator
MKILLVDDDALVLESLEILLSGDAQLQIVGALSHGGEALSFLEHTQVDVILLDIQMPVMDGIEAAQRIRSKYPKVKILMLTTFSDYRTLYRCLEAGASGFLLKSDETEKQIMTIKAVYQGLPVISEQALKQFSEQQVFSSLSKRENEVLLQLAQGLSNKEIAERLCLSEGTVRNCISITLEKLGLRDRTQLAISYWQRKSTGR